MEKPPNVILRILRADHPERVTAAALLVGCTCLGAASVILAVAAFGGKEVGAPMLAVTGAMGALIGYAYAKAKTAEAGP